ncbi:MAG TPA: hypothetical protein VGJ05_04295 [Fimbriiglobus sp.]|jgi:hypothetical protein
MLTPIAKALVFFNLLASVGLLSWAASAAFNRPDYAQKPADVTKGNEDPYADDTDNIERLQWKVEKLSDAIKYAQTGYARSSAAASDAELIREYRAGKFAVKLGEARNGAFKTFVYLPKSALIDVNAPGEPVLGVDKKPVRGLDSVQQDLAKSIRDSDGFLTQSEQRRNEFKALALDMDVLDAKIAKQKDILVQLKNEYEYLSDRRTDWDSQLRTLKKRKDQVSAVMARLAGK